MESKTFLNSVPSLKKFFDGEPAGDLDLDPDSLIKYFQRYKVEVEKRETKDQLARSGVDGMAIFASLDSNGRAIGIPSTLKGKERAQVILQLRREKALKDKDEDLLVKQINRRAELAKKPKKKKKKNKKRQNHVGVKSSILPSSAVVSATPLIDHLDSPGDEDDQDADLDMSSVSAAAATVPLILEPVDGKNEQVDRDTDTDTFLSISSALSSVATVVHPAYGYEDDGDDQDADLGTSHSLTILKGNAKKHFNGFLDPTSDTSHSLTILKGKVKDYFDSFWDPRSTGAGMDFDRQFVPLFEQLGGRIKFSVKGSSHCTLYYKGFKPEGTWRPHPKPELGHKTMLRLRSYFTKWGLTMEGLRPYS